MHVLCVVIPAGLEPAAYSLGNCRSIQMSYGTTRAFIMALPGHGKQAGRVMKGKSLVGLRGFEPPTPCSRSRCATRLRYTPTRGRL